MSIQSSLRASLATILLLFPVAAAALDSDGDGVDDSADNCIETPNDQLDSDRDGYGNACDADFDNDGAVGGDDYARLAELFGCTHRMPCWNEEAEVIDLDGNGAIGGSDQRIFAMQFRRAERERSGLPCAGLRYCPYPPPLPALPVVVAHRTTYADGFDQVDIDAALEECHPGCNLLFLNATYRDVAISIGDFPDGIALYGYRDRDGGDETVLRSPLYARGETWHPVIDVTNDAPDGIVIQGLTLDGRKKEQGVPRFSNGAFDVRSLTRAAGIWTAYPELRRDGIIRNLEIRDFVSAAINLGSVPGWLVDGNEIAGIGCDQVVEPCGRQGADPGAWDRLPDARGWPPGSKANTIAISVLGASHDIVVSNNLVERVTKIGIQVYGAPCIDPTTGVVSPTETRRARFVDNTIWSSRDGITINGGCDHRVERNRVYRSYSVGTVPGATIGNGFVCGYGAGTTWRDNYAIWNDGMGFMLACHFADGIVFDGNRSIGNCARSAQQGASADAYFRGNKAWDEFRQPIGLQISNFVTQGSSCYAALDISRRTDVRITGSDLMGGWKYGILLHETNDVVIENTTLTSSQPAGADDVGIFFNRYQDNPETEPFDDMSDVYVRSSVAVTGFDTTVVFEAPLQHDDGDDIAYCPEETNPPPGCTPGS